jgi:hypothetical protein
MERRWQLRHGAADRDCPYDLGTSSRSIEFGVGHGFTNASDNVIVKLTPMKDL